MAARSLDQPEKAKKARLEVETTEESEATEFDASNPFTKGAAPVEEDEVELKFDDGNSLYVSKGLLSAMSPVFERMFKSNFRESYDRCISMSGKEYDPFLDMLLHVHPRIKKEISDKWITKIHVYEYAHEYQMNTLLLGIEDALCKKVKATKLSAYNCWHSIGDIEMTIALLLFAEKYSISELISTAVKKLSTVPRSMIRSASSYGDLTSNSKFMVLDMRLEKVDNNKYLEDNYTEGKKFSNYL